LALEREPAIAADQEGPTEGSQVDVSARHRDGARRCPTGRHEQTDREKRQKRTDAPTSGNHFHVRAPHLLSMSNVAVVTTPRKWLDTATPISASVGMSAKLCVRCVQVEPSADAQASMTFPVRTSFSQIGNCVGERPPIHCVSAPPERR